MGRDYREEKSGERNWGELKMILIENGTEEQGEERVREIIRPWLSAVQGLGRDKKNTRGVGGE